MKNIQFRFHNLTPKENIDNNIIHMRNEYVPFNEVGLLTIPIYKDKNGASYVNRIFEIVSVPRLSTRTKVAKRTKTASYDYCATVRTKLESTERIYLSKDFMVQGWTGLCFGNTNVNSKSKGPGMKRAYREFERIVGLMLRTK
jgi:hypothetical protein